MNFDSAIFVSFTTFYCWDCRVPCKALLCWRQGGGSYTSDYGQASEGLDCCGAPTSEAPLWPCTSTFEDYSWQLCLICSHVLSLERSGSLYTSDYGARHETAQTLWCVHSCMMPQASSCGSWSSSCGSCVSCYHAFAACTSQAMAPDMRRPRLCDACTAT